MKTIKKAEKFLEFCKKHPDYRFWQALLAFTKMPYILISDRPAAGEYENKRKEKINVVDSFHLQD